MVEKAYRICAADPKCRFVLRYDCHNPSIYPNAKICEYDTTLVASNSTCVYKKEDIDRSGSIFSNDVSDSQGDFTILNKSILTI